MEKVFFKIKLFMKTNKQKESKQTRTERNFLKLMKGIYEKQT